MTKSKWVFLAAFVPVLASAQISEAICGTWDSVMKNQTLQFRQQGLPIGIAQDTYNSEDSVATRVFLKRVVRTIYSDPIKGKSYLESGQFMRECVKAHRGF